MDEIKVELQRPSFKEFGIAPVEQTTIEFKLLHSSILKQENFEYPKIENIFARKNDSSTVIEKIKQI